MTAKPDHLFEGTDDSGWRPVPSSDARQAEQAARILDEALFHASVQGMRGYNVARAVVCGLFLALHVSSSAAELARAQASAWLVTALLGSAVLISFAFARLRDWGDEKKLFAWRIVGVVLDAGLFFIVILVGVVLSPQAHYPGVFALPYVSAAALIVVASALRTGTIFVVSSAVLNTLGLVALALIDRALNAERIAYSLNMVLFQFVLVAGAAVVGYVTARRATSLAERVARRALDAARVKEKLGRYLGPQVAAQALSLDEIELGGARQNIAVLFSDLRNFTATAEHMPPEQLVEQLNAYLDDMVRAIDATGGVVDKYIGDGIMAVWGAPTPRSDDAERALEAARRMQRALLAHNEGRAKRGLPPLDHGIGAHYGPAIAGHVGTKQHAQYTVIGDVVNVASRLESQTKEQGVAVLLSKELVDAARKSAPEADVVRFGSVSLRGRQTPIELYTLAR